jgi:type II restriction enzyme
MELKEAKVCLDKVIKKGRVHLYKPIHIAEVLYRDRTVGDINLSMLETYRTKSRAWRNEITLLLTGNQSTSSARYQDDVFNHNACPPEALVALGVENRRKRGIVEAYIYANFDDKHLQLNRALEYVLQCSYSSFDVRKFVMNFWKEPGLKKSIDKIYEILVYALFTVLVDELGVTVTVSMDKIKIDVLKEFEDFARAVILIDAEHLFHSSPARIYRVGVCNAADRGLDMWANFGPAVQVKHLSLNANLANRICDSISADRIIIVCKDTEKNVILSILSQVGFKSRIQNVVMESQLFDWYDRALRGKFADRVGLKLMKYIIEEMKLEFPSSEGGEFQHFLRDRGYTGLEDHKWSIVDRIG